MQANGPVVWEVAVCVGAGVVFAKVSVDGRAFSRPDVAVKVLNPGRWNEVVPSRYNCLGGVAKTMTAAGWPAALLTLSRQQELSPVHKI